MSDEFLDQSVGTPDVPHEELGPRGRIPCTIVSLVAVLGGAYLFWTGYHGPGDAALVRNNDVPTTTIFTLVEGAPPAAG
jgi:hypothetical protein